MTAERITVKRGWGALDTAGKVRVLRWLDTEIAVRGPGGAFRDALCAVRETLLEDAPEGYDRENGEEQDPEIDNW